MSCDPLLQKLSSIIDPATPQWAMVECFKGVITISKGISYRNSSRKCDVEIVNLNEKIDDLEQRSRNSCLLIHGVDELDGEETDSIALDIIRSKFDVTVDEKDIQRSYRLGPPNKRSLRSNAPRPTIVRFTYYKKVKSCINRKRNLKARHCNQRKSHTKSL